MDSNGSELFRALEGRARRRVLQTSAARVFWNEDLPVLAMSLVGFLETFSDETATSLKVPAQVGYLVHMVVLNFSKEYKKRIIKDGQFLVTLRPFATNKSELMREADSGGLGNPYTVVTHARYMMLENR